MNMRDLLRNAIELLPDPFFAIDKDGRIILWNKAMESLTKVKKKDILGKGDYAHSMVFYGYKRPTLAELVLKPDEEAEKYYYRFKRSEDGTVEGETYSTKMDYYDWGKAVPIFDDSGEIDAILSISRDITDLRKFEKKQEELLKRYEILFANSPDGIACFDNRHVILDVNDSFLKIFGYKREECLGRDLDDLIMPREQKANAKKMTNMLFEKGTVDFEDTRYTKTGEPVIVSVKAILMQLGDEPTLGGYGIYADITERVKYKEELESANVELEATIEQLVSSEEELRAQYDEIQENLKKIEFLASHDPLTGLYNRRKLSEVLVNELDSSGKGAIILLDLDDFKIVNDVLGHTYGDKLLRDIAALIKDLSPKNAVPFRYGGDEFLILIREKESLKIEEHVQRIRKGFSEKIIVNDLENDITVTMGIVKYPLDGKSADELFLKADIALYTAKKSGKNKYIFYNDNLKECFINKK